MRYFLTYYYWSFFFQSLQVPQNKEVFSMGLCPLWIPGEKERKAFLLDLSTIFIRNGNYGVMCSLFKQLKILIDRWYCIRVYQNLGLQSAWECIL